MYVGDRLAGRIESDSFGAVFIEKAVRKANERAHLFDIVGLVEIDENYYKMNVLRSVGVEPIC